MRTTVTLNDDLIASAQELTGITERTELLREGLETLVRVESARRRGSRRFRRGGECLATTAERSMVILVDTSVWIDHLHHTNRNFGTCCTTTR